MLHNILCLIALFVGFHILAFFALRRIVILKESKRYGGLGQRECACVEGRYCALADLTISPGVVMEMTLGAEGVVRR